jgi:hypothetical protein
MSSTPIKERLMGHLRFSALIAPLRVAVSKSFCRRGSSRAGRLRSAIAILLALAFLLSTAFPLSTGQSANASEEARRFLDALRRKEYYDLALEYLKGLQDDPNCPAEMKEVLSYETGLILITSSARLGGTQFQEQLDGAQDAFNKFVAEHPEHPMATAASTQLANVLVARGKHKIRAAGRAGKTEADKKTLTVEARSLYQEAKTALEMADERLYTELKRLQSSKDPNLSDETEKNREDFLYARLSLAKVEFEIGRTYPDASEDFKKHVGSAAEKFNTLYKKYGTGANDMVPACTPGWVKPVLAKAWEKTSRRKSSLRNC